jgi:hypothetical protein
MCTRVGNQQSHGVVIERLRSSVQSLLHQRRDLRQSTYLNLAEDQEPISHQAAMRERFVSPTYHRLSRTIMLSCKRV